MLIQTEQLKQQAHHFSQTDINYHHLFKMIGDAEVVLIGEATHGTEEFYQIRAEITKKLLECKGFNTIAIEADWPDAYKINRYVQGDVKIIDALDSLSEFERFPTWMWQNKVMLDFVSWLKDYNEKLKSKDLVGVYGLDLYSLDKSIDIVIEALDKIDQAAANRARARYSCFNDFRKNLTNYARAKNFKLTPDCSKNVQLQFHDIAENGPRYVKDKLWSDEQLFYIKQNAKLIMDAEQYYSSMLVSDISSWNLRDTYMANTLYELRNHVRKTHNKPAKVVVWAHNSHIGNAQATTIGKLHLELNLGQLIKENPTEKSFALGFMTNTGTVIAANNWGQPPEKIELKPAIKDSYEYHLDKLGENFMLNLNANQVKKIIPKNMLERAIGVVYKPTRELISHYFHADLTDQFDAIIYLRNSHALSLLN